MELRSTFMIPSFATYIYISFGSLGHTSWRKSEHTTISFSMDRHYDLKVELVPRRSKCDSVERVKDTTNSTEFWDTEPIKIIRDSESCIEIQWDDDVSVDDGDGDGDGDDDDDVVDLFDDDVVDLFDDH